MRTAILILIISTGQNQWTEKPVAVLPVEECNIVLDAIWNAPLPVVAVDDDGNAIKSVDAWCMED